MVGNPAVVGVCRIGGGGDKERGREKSRLARASEASKRLEIENTLAPEPARRLKGRDALLPGAAYLSEA